MENPNGFFARYYPPLSSRDERRANNPHVPRRDYKPGRRQSDFDHRTTITKKAMVVIVVIVEVAWYVGGLLIPGLPHGCP